MRGKARSAAVRTTPAAAAADGLDDAEGEEEEEEEEPAKAMPLPNFVRELMTAQSM